MHLFPLLILCFVIFIQDIQSTTLAFHASSSATWRKFHSGNCYFLQSNRKISQKIVNDASLSPSLSLKLHPLGPSTSAMSAIPSKLEIIRTLFGFLLSHRISTSGYKKRSLSRSGALSAFVVASLSLSCSIRSGLTLLAFYWTSSKLTRFGYTAKAKLEEGVTEGGERGALQVLACSAIGVMCACLRRWLVGRDGPLLTGSSLSTVSSSSSLAIVGDAFTFAYVSFFACCAGDTWASELGVLSKSPPRFIIAPWRKVPPGTNGGITLLGLGASAGGGIFMGFLHGFFVPEGLASLFPFFLTSPSTIAQFRKEVIVLTWVGLFGGLGGSLLDSLLGATVQATYYDTERKQIVKRPGSNTVRVSGMGFLSNEMVNVVSTLLTAVVGGLLARPILNRLDL